MYVYEFFCPARGALTCSCPDEMAAIQSPGVVSYKGAVSYAGAMMSYAGPCSVAVVLERPPIDRHCRVLRLMLPAQRPRFEGSGTALQPPVKLEGSAHLPGEHARASERRSKR